MYWQYTPYTLPVLVSAATTAGLSYYIWQRRETAGALPLFGVMAGVLLWASAYALRLSSAQPDFKYLMLAVQYIGVVAAPTLWLVFALHYTGRGDLLGRRLRLGLWAVPLLTLALAWSNSLHGLFWGNVGLRDMGGFVLLDVQRGLFFWLHAAYSYAMLLVGTLLLALTLPRLPHLYRWQVAAALSGIAAPWVLNVVTIFDLSPFPYLDLTPFAFAFTGLAMGWGLFRYRLLDLGPIARETVVERLADGVLVLDAHGRVVDCNPAARQALGRARLEGVSVLEALPALRPLLEGAGEGTAQIALPSPAGERHYEASVVALHAGDGKTAGRLVDLHDITDRLGLEDDLTRLKEEAEAANRAKSDFVARMNHELRTPLSSVMGYADILLEGLFGDMPPKQRQAVEQIRASSDQLLSMINEVLDMAKIEAGKMSLHVEDFDIEGLLEEVADTVRPLVRKNRNLLRVNGAAGSGGMRGDRVKVRQCLLNLLSNAAKFTEDGLIGLGLEERGADVVFVVEDDGIGMSATQAERIFEAYSQADDDTEQRFGGTGLGLSITRHFTEMMGGEIRVDSRSGEGTRFTIRLPRVPDAQEGGGAALI